MFGKPEGKRSLGRPRRRWEDNTKIDLKDMYCEGVDWIKVTHLRFSEGRLYTR
jgi:hypothetical protein